ncbi:SulP family inorganic anion transporter [Streptomyces sp. PKU-MA01144]|uniref:SulP family inorganic anion transporter n=1 Tax=Streptomyces sp. PKU-MA01144 TaxID=2729138 RepID=UPI0014805974|nr:SulP family inorganic anion transporter [Streptomyces sp. PKU-MA01144]NNJ08177.1 SulP family inorganic anion transporter [Streptomyces sp. PKU-MA01144]
MSTLSLSRKHPARHARRAPRPPAPAGGGTSSLVADLLASLVVFLVAVPLCIGIAVASGVPVALGIISGIVGGLVVGFLPGSSIQVSGPAAGLAALVLEFVTEHGLGLLGPVVLATGLLQVVLGALRMGRVFQSISLAVVQGMLAGIGIPLILSQTYALADTPQTGSALGNLAGLPDLLGGTLAEPHRSAALLLGALSVALCFAWRRVPGPVGKVPAPLAVVVIGTVVASLPGFDVQRVSFGNLRDAVAVPGPGDFAGLLDIGVLTTVVTFAVIASAETLFSAAAVDRMHSGPRTRYNAELVSQGIGNSLCGLLGALPITAVIARSSANVQAGARTKVSRVVHGGWLLAFGLLLPGLLGLIPVAVLAGVLVHAGWKLFDPAAFPRMWRTDRGEGVVMVITTVAIVVSNLLEGVLAGLAVAIVLAALRMSRMTTRITSAGGVTRLTLSGNATFLRLPRLIDALESVAAEPRVHVDLSGASHLDLACRSQVEDWAGQRRKAGAGQMEVEVEVSLPDSGTRPADPGGSPASPHSGTVPVASGGPRRPPPGVPGPTPVRTATARPAHGMSQGYWFASALSTGDGQFHGTGPLRQAGEGALGTRVRPVRPPG